MNESDSWESASLEKPARSSQQVITQKFRNNPAKEIHPLERLPPHSTESEAGILGCLIQSPSECILVCQERQLVRESFYDLRHQELFTAIMSLSEAGNPVDVISLQQWLRDHNLLDQIGGLPFINQIEDSSPSPKNLTYYLDIVSEKYLFRKMIQTCTDVVGRIYDHDGSADGLLDAVEREVLAVQADRTPKLSLDGCESGNRMLNDLEHRMSLEGKLSGLDTGLMDLNRITEGFQFGEQVVIGARPSMGKTALGLGILKHAALENKVPSLFISMEMSVEALMRRLLSAASGIPLRAIRKGSFSESDFPKIAAFQSLCKRSPIHILDAISGITCRELCATIRRMVIKHGIKLVVIDYLQKVRPDVKHEKRTYEVADVSSRLKAVAVESNVSLVTLAQLNRENVTQKGRTPRLSDLADSGQIERDADLVALIHRDDDGQAMLLVAKQRDGETATVPLYFNGELCRFESVSRIQED